jgi:hypothetical protein
VAVVLAVTKRLERLELSLLTFQVGVVAVAVEHLLVLVKMVVLVASMAVGVAVGLPVF